MKVFLKNPYNFPFGNFWLLANRNFKNLGFSAFIDDQDKINEIVEIIIKRFDLIMISDYMDESQVSMNLARALDVLIDTGSKSDFA